MKWTSFALAVFGVGCVLLWATPRPAHAVDGEVTFGSQWLEQNRPESSYQLFNDLPHGLFLDSFAARELKDRNLFKLYGVHALRDDQSTNFTWSNGVRWRADLEYSKIPHNISFVTRTPYAEQSAGVFILPDSLQKKIERDPASFAATMTDLLKTARDLDQKLRTDVSGARLRARPARGWQFELVGTRRQRSGRKPYGASLGFNADIELPEPIDQRMIDADARANYYNDRLSLRLSGGVSTFVNHVDKLLWDNPKRLVDTTYAAAYVAGDGTSRGQLDLYPGNRSMRGSVDIGYQLPRQKTVLSVSVTVKQNTQNDAWLPYTVNTAIAQDDTAGLPAASTDAKATVISQDFRVVSHPIDKLSGTLRFQRSHYDNGTKEYHFPGYVRLDQVWEPIETDARPFGNERTTYGLDLDLDPVKRVTVAATVERVQRERTFREVDKDHETTFSGQVRVRPVDQVQLKARYRRGDRKVDHFDVEVYEGEEQPGLRRFDVADRTQDKGDASVSWTPTDASVVSLGYVYVKNNYGETQVGLREERQQTIAADGAFSPAERLDFTASLGLSRTKTDQLSVQSGGVLADPDTAFWTADIKTWNEFAYAGLEFQAVPERLTLMGGFEYDRTPTTFDLANFRATAIDLPDTQYRRRDFLFGATYRVETGTELGLRYDFETFDVADFATTDIPLLFPTSGPTNAVFLGSSIQDYDAHRLAVTVKRSF